jgi:hypothetical protein
VRVLLQVGTHLAERSELHDDPDGRGAAHAHQPDDVRVRELLHYVCVRAGKHVFTFYISKITIP